MTRGKQHANGRTGLWQDTPDEPYVPAHDLRIEEQTSPLNRTCNGCGAQPRQRCTRPGRGGRVELKGYHPSRLEPVEAENPSTGAAS